MTARVEATTMRSTTADAVVVLREGRGVRTVLAFFKGSFLTPAFLKFLGVGVVNAFNGTIFAWLYSLFLQPNVAFVVGYATSVTVSYFLNSWIVFPSRRSLRRYGRFVLSYVPNFLIQNLCVLVVYNLLGFHELIAYVLAAAVGVPVTFLLLKFFAFGGKTVLEEVRAPRRRA